MVADGRDVISEFPTDRWWDLAGLFDPAPQGSTHTRLRGSGGTARLGDGAHD